MVDPSQNTRLNPPQPIRTNVKDRQLPQSQPPLVTPPRAMQPPPPMALPRKPTLPSTVTPPDQHKGAKPLLPNEGPKPSHVPGEGPTVGFGPPPQMPAVYVPRILPATPIVQRPPRQIDTVDTKAPTQVLEPRYTGGECPRCHDTKMVNVKMDLTGVIYSYEVCSFCVNTK